MLLLLPWSYYYLSHRLRGEHFFRLRSTDFWKEEVWRFTDQFARPWRPLLEDRLLARLGFRGGLYLPALVEDDPTAVPVLHDLLHDPDTQFRAHLSYLVFWNAKPCHVPLLVEGLGLDPESVRDDAAEGLVRLGPAAAAAVPPLLHLLRDGDPSERLRAAFVLRNIAPQDPAVVAALIANLGQPEWEVRRDCAEALADSGPAARPAVPALMVLLRDGEGRVRWSAFDALKKIDPEAARAAGEPRP